MIQEEADSPDWQETVTNLAKDHEQVAEEIGDEATSDVVVPRLTLHEKTARMLRAIAH